MVNSIKVKYSYRKKNGKKFKIKTKQGNFQENIKLKLLAWESYLRDLTQGFNLCTIDILCQVILL